MKGTDNNYSICVLVGLVWLSTSQATALFMHIANNKQEQQDTSFEELTQLQNLSLHWELPHLYLARQTSPHWHWSLCIEIGLIPDSLSSLQCRQRNRTVQSKSLQTLCWHHRKSLAILFARQYDGWPQSTIYNKTQSSYISTAHPCISSCIIYIYNILYIYKQQSGIPSTFITQSNSQIKLTNS